ncbi:hypothetical protein [Pseudoalteromonas rhizosphaerae]|uniref:hypothetical protein n=1 Tax=Pseudoalteromonas rhizosphaerae TaxID=2518973 RepID=UPI0021474600|nr:hypothetical protein [Pseudoalteromonas rhizosphaerae]
MNISNTQEQSVTQVPSEQKAAAVETSYSGQKPQFKQSANKPKKTLAEHRKHSDISDI